MTLNPERVVPVDPLVLIGDSRQRGLAQAAAASGLISAVRNAVLPRLEENRVRIKASQPFLKAQWDFMAAHGADHLTQLRGLSEGYGLNIEQLFTYLHLGTLDDAGGLVSPVEDGCSVIALDTRDYGPVVAKNRDYRGEHKALQRVLLEEDPAWKGRRIMAVGSLGSPGAFSSGINSDGLAIVDTRIGWTRPVVGWLRYFLMNEILIKAGNLEEALDLINAVPHLGGGSLLLMDAAGKSAAVELGGGRRIHVARANTPGVAHSNHYLDPDLALGQTVNHSSLENSHGRLHRLQTWLGEQDQPTTLSALAALMASHGESGAPALCRHGGDDLSETISCALFACASRSLYFSPANPCSGDWHMYRL